MKLKLSTLLLIAILLIVPLVGVLITHFQIFGLVGWILMILVLATAASKARTKEKMSEGAAK